MPYGLRFRNAANAIFFDSTTITRNFIDNFVVAAGATVVKDYAAVPYVTEFYTYVQLVNSVPTNQQTLAPSCTWANKVLTVSGGNITTQIVVFCR